MWCGPRTAGAAAAAQGPGRPPMRGWTVPGRPGARPGEGTGLGSAESGGRQVIQRLRTSGGSESGGLASSQLRATASAHLPVFRCAHLQH